MRYKLFFLSGETVKILNSEDLEQAYTRKEAGIIWFSSDADKELYIFDTRFDFWQQATVNHQDKIRTLGVVRTEYVPPLVRMHHLIG